MAILHYWCLDLQIQLVRRWMAFPLSSLVLSQSLQVRRGQVPHRPPSLTCSPPLACPPAQSSSCQQQHPWQLSSSVPLPATSWPLNSSSGCSVHHLFASIIRCIQHLSWHKDQPSSERRQRSLSSRRRAWNSRRPTCRCRGICDRGHRWVRSWLALRLLPLLEWCPKTHQHLV